MMQAVPAGDSETPCDKISVIEASYIACTIVTLNQLYLPSTLLPCDPYSAQYAMIRFDVHSPAWPDKTDYVTLSFHMCKGIIFQYGITIPFLFWVVHIGYMIVLLQFPFFGERKLTKRSVTITIHVVSVVSIFLFQLLWPVITLSAFQYDITRFPPFRGQPGNIDLLFYSVVVTNAVAGGSGILMLVILTFLVHKVGVWFTLLAPHA